MLLRRNHSCLIAGAGGKRFIADNALAQRVRAACVNHIHAGGPVPLWQDAAALLQLSTGILQERKNVQPLGQEQCVEAKGVTVWGDVHGQGRDVLHLLRNLGEPSTKNPFLFNGDIVDRGPHGSELVLMLASYVVEAPSSIWVNRGNHEVPSCYADYGFAYEMKEKYSDACRSGVAQTVYQGWFKALPMAHVIDNAVFVVHGGPPRNRKTTIDQLNQPLRFEDEPKSPFYDMLWSDPNETEGHRGAVFSASDVKTFLETNGLKMVLRSHEMMKDGYRVHHNGLSATVFSAPNYCGRCGNKAAVAVFEFGTGGVPKWLQFDAYEEKKSIG